MSDAPNFMTGGGVGWTTVDSGLLDGPFAQATGEQIPMSIQFAMHDGRQWKVSTIWSLESGRLEPASVTIVGAGHACVVADVLRRLPIGTMQQTARRDGARLSARAKAARSDWRPDVLQLLDNMGRGHRGVATTPDEIQRVADVYLEAWGAGRPVTEAVADEFLISKSTAGKRIMKARRAGLLDRAARITRP
jgi:hypothetical protein